LLTRHFRSDEPYRAKKGDNDYYETITKELLMLWSRLSPLNDHLSKNYPERSPANTLVALPLLPLGRVEGASPAFLPGGYLLDS